jgi:hypothetical protein
VKPMVDPERVCIWRESGVRRLVLCWCVWQEFSFSSSVDFSHTHTHTHTHIYIYRYIYIYYRLYTFNAICKDNAAMNCRLLLFIQKTFIPSTMRGNVTLVI